MASKTYSDDDLRKADELALIIASVPEPKQAAFTRFMEAVMIGIQLGQTAQATAAGN